MMMKRLILIMLAMLLLSMPAVLAEQAPETRQETIRLEGMEERITTTRFVSPRGYAFWYDPEIIVPREADEGNDIDDFVRPDAVDDMYQLSVHYGEALGYSFEQAATDVEQTMKESYSESGVIEKAPFSFECQGFYGRSGDQTSLYYVVKAGDGAFYIHVRYPSEAAEGFGDRIGQMLESFEIVDVVDGE